MLSDCGKLKKLIAVIGANTHAPWLSPLIHKFKMSVASQDLAK
jgi:hypothetical protein